MNGFVLIARYTSDDLPVALFATANEAKRAAEKFRKTDVPAAFKNGMVLESDHLFCLHLVEFRHGVAIDTYHVCDTKE